MSTDEARAEVAKVIEQALDDLGKAQRDASRGIDAQIRMASREQVEAIRAQLRHGNALAREVAQRRGYQWIAETRAITGDPQELGANGSLALKRSELPSASIGDEVLMWLKADTALGGRHARMECVEMTSDTLTFREVGK